ncbi:MAG: TAXI family TRAP transporter solute-binding subunit [Pirellulaceae bacterium]
MFTVKSPHCLVLPLALLAIGLLISTGCTPRDQSGGGKSGKRQFVDIGTSPPGGVFNPVGSSVAETLNTNKGDAEWKAQAKTSKGSQENIRKLTSGEFQLAVSNSAISHFATTGEGTWDQKHDIRAIATLAPNVAMFVTRKNSGIETIADLKGKSVVCGPPGAGFEMFIGPILEAHGLSFDDFTKSNEGQSATVDMLADGQADAAFLGGAVPAPALQRLCNEQDVHFIPFEESAMDDVIEQYAFFWRQTIPQDKYSDLESDYNGLNVGSMHLIASADMDEETVYTITKILWENRESTTLHPAARFNLTEENAVKFTGTPFHPGAIRYYKEAGIWPAENDADRP